MRLILLIVASVFLFSCSNNSAISKKLSGSDSLVINFTLAASDSIVKTVSTTEPKAIKKLVQFVDGKQAEENKCGYDGQLLFFVKGIMVSDAYFKYTDPGCRFFLMELDGKLQRTRMSNEAADFLQGLAEGRNSY